jgi:hypothetical protein
VKLTNYLHLVPRLRTSGAVPLLYLYAFMACTGTSLLLPVHDTRAVTMLGVHTPSLPMTNCECPHTLAIYWHQGEACAVQTWGNKNESTVTRPLPVPDATDPFELKKKTLTYGNNLE